MENRIWYQSDDDITSLFNNKDFEALQSYVTLNKRLLIHLWETEQIDELQKSLRFGTDEMNYLENWLKSLPKENDYYLIFLLGSLSGILELMDRILYQHDQLKKTMNDIYTTAAATKHLSEVVMALEAHGTMTHSDLRTELNMNASTLTEAMKKILQTGLVKAAACGKYKLYNLTEAGRQYGKTIHNLRSEKHTSEELLAAISQAIEDSEDSTELRRQIEQLLTGQTAHTISVGDKLSLTYKENELIKKDYYRIDMILENEFPGNAANYGCSKIDALDSMLQNDWPDSIRERTSA